MKKLVLAVLTVVSFSSFAEDKAESEVERCALYATLAENIMSARQSGVPMIDMLKLAEDGEIEKVATYMITEAFEVPKFDSEDYRKKHILDFKNKMTLMCIKAGKK